MELRFSFLSAPSPADFSKVAELADQLGYPSTAEEMAARYAVIASNESQGIAVGRVFANPTDSPEAIDPQGGIVGWIHFRRGYTFGAGARLEILGLVVDQSLRGLGIGSDLIRQAEHWGKMEGLERVRFTSNVKRTEAHRLYERLGYAVSKTSHVFEKSLF